MRAKKRDYGRKLAKGKGGEMIKFIGILLIIDGITSILWAYEFGEKDA